MKKENENCLVNLRTIVEKLLNTKDEREIKNFITNCWAWLAIRAIAERENPIDKVLPIILEAIEQDYEWGIPTMDEIEKKVKATLNPNDD